MKSKKYENFSMLPFLLIFAIIFFIFLLIFSFRVSFIKIYHSIPGVVVGPNQVMVLLSSKDLSKMIGQLSASLMISAVFLALFKGELIIKSIL